jgi:hypothetical protein
MTQALSANGITPNWASAAPYSSSLVAAGFPYYLGDACSWRRHWSQLWCYPTKPTLLSLVGTLAASLPALGSTQVVSSKVRALPYLARRC